MKKKYFYLLIYIITVSIAAFGVHEEININSLNGLPTILVIIPSIALLLTSFLYFIPNISRIFQYILSIIIPPILCLIGIIMASLYYKSPIAWKLFIPLGLEIYLFTTGISFLISIIYTRYFGTILKMESKNLLRKSESDI